MLVVTLYDGEFVTIGDDVKVYIESCIDDGNQTRLGIEAPREVTVLREELVSKNGQSNTR